MENFAVKEYIKYFQQISIFLKLCLKYSPLLKQKFFKRQNFSPCSEQKKAKTDFAPAWGKKICGKVKTRQGPAFYADPDGLF
jgi:hypothetical protein